MSVQSEKGRLAISVAICVAGLGAATCSALAQDGVLNSDAGAISKDRLAGVVSKEPDYSPWAGRNYPTKPLWGDTHLHSGASFDAGAAGATVGPRDAYRLARGEEITSSTGQQVRLSRPLDFLVVADHSDNMGFMPDLLSGKPEILANPKGRKWYDLIKSGKGDEAFVDMLKDLFQQQFPEEIMYVPGSRGYAATWENNIAAAEEFNDPGHFTAFIAYEWSAAPKGNNLHRNVIYRDGADKASQMEPIVTQPPFGSPDPTTLWAWMESYEEKTGGNLLAIAHNGNLSNGEMFPVIEAFGKKIDEEWITTRAKWEPLVEVSQTKGTSEAHPVLSPDDDFADFELWDWANLDVSAVKTPDMLPTEYAREALKNGLRMEQDTGTNPYKFGMIGSTDSHTGLSTAEESNFFGKISTGEPSKERLTSDFVRADEVATGIGIADWQVSASGRIAVWANENTRASIFDAMERKEVFGTTGPRMSVRLFGGWDFEPGDEQDRMLARTGYEKGVPMGGDLLPAPEGKSPTFLVAALKDSIGANLDRIQIIKGWVDANGETQERVYDVAVSDGRTIDPDGRCRTSVGSTVDIENATWKNTIGAGEMATVWEDPDFDPALRAFYYARVIEIPTPRWPAYDVKRYGNEAEPETLMTVTERAYSSPIWYTPLSSDG
ncbi:DUF3604 domain-containing protein [Ruegeria atlantica]|uniref:DUF3604 domain-containing protein n=1 Tax=Ruegeria atlantica TaxID=81569 RepID=A0A0P1F468_9RHOB|nr:DUF3604 domain-containing protein [Ruegeria atlantica]CUH48776.1 hypothetical protein RUA4292_02965 [Ruegeria atlantica]